MSTHRSMDVPPAVTAGRIEEDVGGHGERSVGTIREEFGSTVAGLKQKYGLLLEERDRRIKHLLTKLTPGSQEESKRRVLIVDDAESTAEIVNRHLEGHLVEVVQVAPPDAPQAIRLHKYDVTMIEAACVVGPHVDGATFCRQLCDSGDRRGVVLMSSRPGSKIKDSAEEAGAMFLRKPFRRAQLVEILRRIPGALTPGASPHQEGGTIIATTLLSDPESRILGTNSAVQERGGKFLTFQLADEEYGIEILKVREINGLMDITAMPQMPAYMKGVINLRNKVIPIVDLRLRFGLPEVEPAEQTCIIVVNVGKEIGVIVDNVHEVVDIAGESIESPPSFGCTVDTSFILGMGKVGDAVKILLDIDRVLQSRAPAEPPSPADGLSATGQATARASEADSDEF